MKQRSHAGAAKFLAHPRVAEASLEKRVAFLKSQDIPEEDIETALTQASMNDGEAAADEGVPDEDHHKPRRKKKKKKMKKKKAAAELNPQPPTPSIFSCFFCQK